MSAAELYEKIKADFERLERIGAARGEWVQFSNRLVEAVMKVQAIVIDHQKQLLAAARGSRDGEHVRAARQGSRDAIAVLDSLSVLHERTRVKLLS